MKEVAQLNVTLCDIEGHDCLGPLMDQWESDSEAEPEAVSA